METILFDSGRTDKYADLEIVNLGALQEVLKCGNVRDRDRRSRLVRCITRIVSRGGTQEKGDVWSIGVTGVYLLSGSKPFQGQYWEETLQGLAFNSTEDTWRYRVDRSQNVCGCVARCENPNNRPDVAKAMNYRWVARSTLALSKMVRSKVEEEVRVQPYHSRGRIQPSCHECK
jgi:hypothetical protein